METDDVVIVDGVRGTDDVVMETDDVTRDEVPVAVTGIFEDNGILVDLSS